MISSTSLSFIQPHAHKLLCYYMYSLYLTFIILFDKNGENYFVIATIIDMQLNESPLDIIIMLSLLDQQTTHRLKRLTHPQNSCALA